ncbi:MAG: very short patch repair endonuclease [Caldilineaceae bacterium]|nr:very short patch repair endonuclease [Caldilineaceae bacterium]MBP8122784.1 very short patch repair endonuclease [Caldilineaceae bacterium]MBP9072904.1 very short patch repair endonuclease [Caldilineaceae bacterium]
MMTGIRSKDTKPEMIIRKALHSRGLRYRLHDASLPGKPDLVFRKQMAVIQIQGCFWHGHQCHLFHWPVTRADFWFKKISDNRERDTRNAGE